MKIRLKAAAATDQGQRTNNEDSFAIDIKKDVAVIVVADGLGGHLKGEVASRYACDEFSRLIAETSLTEDSTLDEVVDQITKEKLWKEAVIKVGRNIYQENEKLMQSKELEGAPDIFKKRSRMGTTLVSLSVQGKQACIFHVGDSRAYQLHQDKLKQITDDQTWVAAQVRAGNLTPEQAMGHEKRNVLVQCVGSKEEIVPDVHILSLEPGERFLLCTDGLSNMLSEHDIKTFLQRKDLQTACREMVTLAKERGGRDNITAVIVDIGEEGEMLTKGEYTLD